ncbi:MAG: hypothetical protein R3296_00210 [Oleiphilaceae bacterium]|nr:hypothetical protein [Oleiphilaceae bacterium]
MKLERLTITRMPGLREGFTLQPLDPGLNLVTGPNGVGKSSLVRALRYLLAEDDSQDPVALTLEADFRASGETLQVTRTGSQRVWQRNGRADQPPSLPAGDFLHCYWIAMDDLMGEGASDRAILDQLQREMAGGFDLGAVRQSGALSLGKRHGANQEKAFLEKEEALRRVRQRYQSLEQERQNLPALEEKIRAARQAEQRRGQIQQALHWLEDRQQRLSAEQQLQRFPRGMEQLHGDEQSQLEQREAQIERLESQLREATQSKHHASQRLEQTGLSQQPPKGEEMAARREDLSRLERLSQQIDERREALDQARADRQRATEALSGDPDNALSITPQQVDQAGRLAERIESTAQRLQSLPRNTAHEAPDESQTQSRQRLIDELRRWLRQLPATRLRHLLAGNATALLAGLLLAGLAISRALPLSAALSLVVLAGAAWSLWQLRGLGRTRQETQHRVAGLPLEGPQAWTVEAVSQRLEQLEQTLAEDRLQRERAEQASLLESQREPLQESLSELEAEKARLAEAIGFDPAATALGLHRFAALMQRLDQSASRCRELEQNLERLLDERQKAMERVRSLLQQQGVTLAEEPDLSDLRSHFQSLEQRLEQLREARNDLERAREHGQGLEQSLAESREALECLYRRVGLSAGQRRELMALCEQRAEYRQLCDRLQQARVLENDRARGLAGEPDLVALVESGDSETLKRQLDEQQRQAAELEPLRQQLADLQARLNQAGQDRALARARLEREKARDALQDAWSQAMQAEAGQFLLQQVTLEHRSEHQPRVLSGARERFAGFTHQRYDLQLDEEGGLLVHDSLQGGNQSPATLSTGTHMQLFLALRLAWTSLHEGQGEPLPLFLDEALTTSDPERFARIVRNLETLAEKEDRQIFYLSAEPGDHRRWEQVLEKPVHHLDLQQLRFGQPAPGPGHFTLADPEPVPPPGDQSAADYAARLGVPPVRPYQPAGAIHLFHLLRDDLDTLHRLMAHWRTERMGPLETLLDSPAATAALGDAQQVGRMQGRCRTARAWRNQWLRGRGLPVDRNALEQSGAITETFMEPVCQQARALEGDAGALLAALRNKAVPRFQQSKTDELEQWLLESGYLSREMPLSPQERERQTLLQVGETVPPDEALAVIRFLEGGLADQAAS